MAAIAWQIGCEETWKDYQGLIVTHCQRFCRQYGLFHWWDDVKEEAQYIFVEAYLSYEEDKAAFRTWLILKLQGGLIDRFLRHHPSRREEPIHPEQPSNQDDTRLVDLLDELSDDASTVARLVLETPGLLAQQVQARGGSSTSWRVTLREYLTELGWSRRRIINTFNEIGRALR